MADNTHIIAAWPAHCSCRSGRDFDGSEFGPCEYCERFTDEERERRAFIWDALRWRFTQRPGYYVNSRYEFSDTESSVVAVYAGGSIAGCGRTLKDAIDCALYLLAEHGDGVTSATVRGFWRAHLAERHDPSRPGGQRWVKPAPPRFELLDDDETVTLSVHGTNLAAA